jgi:hypothetical protein
LLEKKVTKEPPNTQIRNTWLSGADPG